MKGERRERENITNKPIVILIGGGSRLPAIWEYTNTPDAGAYISLVVSHKKEASGIRFALERKIPAIYFNFAQWKAKTGKDRPEYMEALGFLISQSNYKPELVVAAGWDIILLPEFLRYFKRPDGYCNVINLHPAPLPNEVGAKTVKLSDGTEVPVIKGEIDEVLPQVLKLGVKKWGSTVHFLTEKVDEGPVIVRSEVDVLPDDTLDSLKERLQKAEDELLPRAISLLVKDKVRIENGRVVIVE
ncbi:hypothetical protein HYV21_01885 [Candidatus Microgenomates bacterium]|nr:hypothetical protein [Candidatus Microgenomates bacterium]